MVCLIYLRVSAVMNTATGTLKTEQSLLIIQVQLALADRIIP